MFGKEISYILLFLIGSGISLGVSNKVFAAEQRCNELISNCVCSESLNTQNYSLVSGTSWGWNPDDSTTKQCKSSGWAGVAYENSTFNLTVDTAATNPTMFAALPAGAAVTYIPRSYAGAGMGAMGTKFTAGVDPVQRRVFRFYRYYSPDHQFTDSTAPNCNSGKVFQGGFNGAYTGGPMLGIPGGWFIYDIAPSLQWSGAFAANSPFAGAVGSLPSPINSMRGKWFRFEIAINGTGTTPGTTSIEWYLKNVTDNTPEITVLNTASDPRMNGIYPTSELTDFAANGFRSNNGDACSGYIGQTHVLAAAFSTNAGQRIGAACEVEGGCGTPAPTPTPDTTAPSTPTSLIVTTISSTQINLSWTASTDNMGVTGYRIYRGGSQIATAAGTTYSSTGLSPSTAYSYTVSAYDASGNTSVQSASASATTQTASTAPIVGTVTLVDFGATASANTFGLTGWNTVIKDVYTLYQSAGPGGTMGGVNGGYDFQGVTGTSRTFSAGDQITVTWHNSSAASQTFTPQISMTNAGRFWNTPSSYSMSQVTLSPGATATSQFTFTSSTAGSYSLVNVNVNLDYSTIICDKIVLIPSGTPTPDISAPSTPTGLTATAVSTTQINLSWSPATDNVAVSGYRIYRNGTQIATSATNSYSDTALSPSTTYSYIVAAYDTAGNISIQSASVSATTQAISIPDTTAPSVSLTAPAANATVSSTITVPASASDNVGVSGVQFKLDGANLGTEDITAPYSIIWDTTTSSNGLHTLTAIARDAAGNTTTSTGVSVTVSNTVSGAICEAATGSKCYYVSNTAGSGTGTFANPYGMADLPRSDTTNCSLSSPAIGPLMPGDVLYFRGGSYSFTTCGAANYWAMGYIRPARSGLAGKPITFKAYPSETVQVQVGSGTQPTFGTVGLNYIRFQGFTVLGGFGMITGRNNEISYNEIIGSFVNNVFNHDGISIGIYGDVTDAPWIHHNIIRGVTGLSENSTGLKFYSTTNAIIEDNYIHDNTSGIHNKHGNQDNTFRRNWVSNNQKAQIMGGSGPDERWRAFIYDNVIDGNGVNSLYVSGGSEIHDNLIRGDTLAGTWQGDSTTSNIWNNVVLSTTGSIRGYYDSVANFVSSGAAAQLNYMNYNLYNVSPSYPFGQYTTTPQNFTLLDMKNRGFEQNSSVATSPQIFVDEISYSLQNPWKTSGRYGDAYGPDNIAQIINPNRYGPTVLLSGSPSAPTPTPPPTSTKFSLNDRIQSTATLNVRATASATGSLLGSQSANALGTIVGGPTNSGGFNWWNVNYDTGVDGWSVEDYLVKYVAPVADTTVPTTPTSLTATAISTTQINLSWSASTDNIGVTGYKIYRNGTQIATSATNSYSNTGLSASTAYSYTVSAYDAAGNTSVQSASASATTQAITPTPISLTPTPGPNDTIIFQDDFEGGNLSKWDEVSPSRYSITSVPANIKSGTGALEALIDSTSSGNLGKWYMPGYDEVYVAFDVKFETGFQNMRSDGYGMHFFEQLGNRTDNQWSASGQAGIRPNGTDFFESVVDPNQIYNDPTLRPLHFYTYYPDMTCPTAPALCYGNIFSQTAPESPFTSGVWHRVVFRIKANTVGQKDGAQSLWFDGTQKIDMQNMRWRDTTNLKLNQLRFDFYLPGAIKTEHAWIDNLVAWTPSATYTPPPLPPASTKFILNDRIQSTATLNVRSTPSTSGTLLGSQTTNTLGTVIGGPANANGFNWWNINYDTGVDGWSVEDYLVTYTAPTADTTAPTTPTSLTATAFSSTQINLSWTASTDAVGVTGYRIERCQGSACTTFAQIATPITTTYSDTLLTVSTAYSYRIRALDAAGNLSGYSATASATTPAAPDTLAPTISLTAPLSGATVSGTTVTLSASASDNSGVGGVQFKLDGSNLGTEDTTAPYSITWNTTSATNGAHALTATARDAAGNQTTSTGVSVTTSNSVVTPDTTPPTTPINLSTTPISSTQINLAWTASTDNVGVAGYRVYRNGTQITTVTTPSYSNTGLSPSTSYTYTVSAYDAAGNTSAQSTSASGSTQSAPVVTATPPPPSTNTNTPPASGATGSISPTPTPPITTPTVSTPTTPSTPTSSLSLTRNLYRGTKGTDVQSLQTFLIQQNYLAPTNNTGFYGSLTQKAVEKYQCARNLICSGTEVSTGYGVVGPKTRTALNTATVSSGTTTSFTTNLTSAQVDAILSVLESFGAEQAVIEQVKRSLGR